MCIHYIMYIFMYFNIPSFPHLPTTYRRYPGREFTLQIAPLEPRNPSVKHGDIEPLADEK